MAKQSVNIGTSANDGTGDKLRDAFDKLNDNFNEIYSTFGNGTTLNASEDDDGNVEFTGEVEIAGDLKVDTDTLFVDVSADAVGIGKTTNLNYLLNLYGGASTAISFRSSVVGNTATDGAEIGIYNSDLYFNQRESANIYFNTGATKRFEIKSGGDAYFTEKLGIGLTNPNSYSFNGDANLVAGNTSGNGTISIASSTTGSGYLAFADGTSGTARYSGRIDYSHTNNEMQFWTNGTPKMTVDSSGNVGIGTTNPYFKLTTNLETAAASFTNAVGDFPFMVQNEGVNALGVAVSDDDIVRLVTNNGHTLAFNNGSTENVRLTTGGYLGIGTNNPDSKLHVESSGNTVKFKGTSSTGSSDVYAINDANHGIRILTYGSGYTGGSIASIGANGTVIFGTTSSSDFAIGQYENNDFSLITNNTKRLTVAAGGSVGIGNTNPDANAKLDVYGGRTYLDATNEFTIRLSDTGTIGGFIGTPASGSLAFYGSTGTERMRIDSSGNVGIGTTSPNHLLDVEAAGASARIFNLTSNSNADLYISTTGTTGASRILFGDTADNDAGKILYRHNGDSLAFETAANEAMRIDSSGNVGIGTTSPNQLLDVESDSTPSIRITNTKDWASPQTGTFGQLEFYTTDTSGAGARVVGFIKLENDAASSVPEGELSFGTALGGGSSAAATEKMRIDSSGVSTFKPANTTSGNRNTKFDALIIKSDYSGGDGAPYTGFGGGIVFNNETYNGTFYDSAAIYSEIGDDSVATTAGGRLLFYTSSTKTASPTEKMRIDSSGNVLINQDSSSSTFTYGGTGIDVDGVGVTSLKLNYGTSKFEISSRSGDVLLYDSAGRHLRFGVSGGEKMRIHSSGNILLGTTTTTSTSDGVRYFPTGSGTGSLFNAYNGGSGTATLFGRNDDGTVTLFYRGTSSVGSISVSSSATAYNTSSDYRLKTDLKDFSGTEMLSNIKMYDFKWKESGERTYGVMAHELQEVLPQAVTGEKDGEEMQAVDYSKIVPVLVKALQEQQKEIEYLKSKIQ
jgi:hypothetical protein